MVSNGADLAALVEADPNREAAEKDTGFGFYGTDDHALVHSYKPTVVKSLCKHDHTTLNWAVGVDGDHENAHAYNAEQAAALDAIHGVSVDIPIGCLTVKSAPRSNNHQSNVVNHEGVDPDAFGGDDNDE